MRVRRLCAVVPLACAIGFAALAEAPATGVLAVNPRAPHPMSTAGYSATGAHFQTVESWIKLPDPARFSRYAGRISISAQLWSARLLFDLKFTACTNRRCRPGAGPAVHSYRMEFTVYRRSTGAVVCSTAATTGSRCTDTGRSWATQRCRPGSVGRLAIVLYSPWVNVSLGGAGCDASSTYYPVAQKIDLGQARLGVEFGATPWTPGLIRRPAKSLAIATFDRPPPPPDAAEIATEGGSTGGIASAYWAHHVVEATGTRGQAQARPGRLFDDGYGFTVYLVP